MRLIHMPSAETDEEKYLYEQIGMLQEAYYAATKPIVDRLVAIKRTGAPRYYLEFEPGDAPFVPGNVPH